MRESDRSLDDKIDATFRRRPFIPWLVLATVAIGAVLIVQRCHAWWRHELPQNGEVVATEAVEEAGYSVLSAQCWTGDDKFDFFPCEGGGRSRVRVVAKDGAGRLQRLFVTCYSPVPEDCEILPDD